MHTNFPKHKRVLVILRDGQSYVDRWVSKTDDSRHIILEKHGQVRIKRIRNISIYKPAPHERQAGEDK